VALRIGIDLVAVEDVREALRAHGEHYLRRVYTPQEVRDCTVRGDVEPERLAGRFAAKEAALKVLRPAGSAACPLTAIEVVRDPEGWVSVRLTGAAAELASRAGLADLALSVSHEAGFATAIVISENLVSGR